MIENNLKLKFMIRHIVMWKFRRDMEETPQQIALEMKERLESLVGKIDGLIKAEVGVNIKETASSFDAVLTSDFTSWEAMEAYKVHPLHVVISDYCKERRLERVDVDYNI
jgi:hypothetical protein